MRPAISCASARRAALTLLESLIAVGILGMLFALSFSAVSAARSMALRTERMSWYRQRVLGQSVPRRLPIKVLFIGNSYTATNDLPGMLMALAEAAGAEPPLIAESHTVGGAKLQDHWDGGGAVDKIQAGEWDFVVLQEQSQTVLPQFGRDRFFYPFARRFEAVIRAQKEIPLFFMTWARPDTPGPQSWWTEPYVEITKRLSAECCPAGVAMEKARQGLPHIQLLADSEGHPTPEGTYLVACTFFATIYDKLPDRLPASVSTGTATVALAPGDAKTMQTYAWEAVQEIRRRAKPEWR